MVAVMPHVGLRGIIDQRIDHETQRHIDWLFDQLVSADDLSRIATNNGLLLDTSTDLEKGQILQAFKENISFKSQRLQGTRQNTLDVVLSYRDIEAHRSKAVVMPRMRCPASDQKMQHSSPLNPSSIWLRGCPLHPKSRMSSIN